MTMRMRQVLVALGIAVIVIWAVLVMARPSGRAPVASVGPSPTGGIGVPASTALPSASAASPSPAGPSGSGVIDTVSLPPD